MCFEWRSEVVGGEIAGEYGAMARGRRDLRGRNGEEGSVEKGGRTGTDWQWIERSPTLLLWPQPEWHEGQGWRVRGGRR